MFLSDEGVELQLHDVAFEDELDGVQFRRLEGSSIKCSGSFIV